MRIICFLLLTLVLAACQPIHAPSTPSTTPTVSIPATRTPAASTPTPTPITVPTLRPETMATAEVLNLEHEVWARMNRADVMIQAGWLDRAEEYLDEALAIDPSSGEARMMRSVVRSMLGDKAGSEADAALLTEADMENPNVLFLHADTLAASGDFEGALAEIEEVMEVSDFLYQAGLPQRGLYLVMLGRVAEGIADLDEAVLEAESSRALAINLYHRAFAYLLTQELEQARLDLEEAISLGLPGIFVEEAEHLLTTLTQKAP